MSAPDELQRAVERLDTALRSKASHVELRDFTSDLRLLLSERAELLATVERMRGALDELQDVFAHENECSMDRFERLAEMFRKDTGFMAPGKDRGVGSADQPDGPELHRIYDAWFSAKVTRARAALTTGEEK